MSAWAFEAMDTIHVCDEDWPGPSDEWAAFHDSGNSADPILEPGRIGDRTECAIEKPIAAVSDLRLTRRRRS